MIILSTSSKIKIEKNNNKKTNKLKDDISHETSTNFWKDIDEENMLFNYSHQ